MTNRKMFWLNVSTIGIVFTLFGVVWGLSGERSRALSDIDQLKKDRDNSQQILVRVEKRVDWIATKLGYEDYSGDTLSAKINP